MLRQLKVYKDGIHYIGIPHKESKARGRRPRHEDLVEVVEEAKDEEKAGGEDPSAFSDVVPMPERNGEEETGITVKTNTPCPRKATKKEIFEKLYDKYKDLKKREKKRKIYEAMKVYFPNKERAAEYVEANFRRKRRNLILRRLRLTRKVALHRFNFFVTFTYNSELHDEESFRKGLKTCFRNFCFRKGWRYVGVWERSPEKKRLHFHGLFYIPEGTMPGELTEVEDYSFKTHARQKTVQNTYFNERFGRSDFEELDPMGLRKATAYIMKYMEKTGEKVVYSKGLSQFFVCDVKERDVALAMGEYGEKLLLFDDFECYSDGKLVGIVSEEVIRRLPDLP